jgi:hypothetical protein
MQTRDQERQIEQWLSDFGSLTSLPRSEASHDMRWSRVKSLSVPYEFDSTRLDIFLRLDEDQGFPRLLPNDEADLSGERLMQTRLLEAIVRSPASRLAGEGTPRTRPRKGAVTDLLSNRT